MNFFSCSFCCQFIKVSSVRASANYMNTAVSSSCDLFQFFCCFCIAFSKTGVDNCCDLAHCFRNFLSCSTAVVFYFFCHIFWRKETFIICIYSGREVFCFFCHCADFCKAVFVIYFMTYRLDHPQTHDVFDITETTFVSAFVCEVQLTALSGAVRSFSFDTHQRPCSRADVNEIIIVSRYCKYRRTCIMCCRCNYF